MAKVDPAKLKDEAAKHLRKGKLDKALESYRQLEKASPHDLKVPQKVAEILQKMDRKQEAVAKYKEAAEKYYNKGFLVQAIAIYKIVIELSPEDTEVKNALDKLSRERQDDTFSAIKPSRVSEKIQSAPPAKKKDETPEKKPEPEPEQAKEEPPIETEPETPEPSPSEAEAPAEEAVPVEPETEEQEAGEPYEFDSGEQETDLEEEAAEKPPEDMEVVPVEDEEELPESGPERTPLLSDLDPPEFERVFELMESRIVQPDEAVVEQGESGDSLFIVARGKVKVVRDENEKQKTLATLGPGDFFGEIGYFHGKREASVIAVKRSLLLEMAKQDLDEVVKEFPRVKEVLLQFYRERVLDNLLRSSPLFKKLSEKERKQFGDSFHYREIPEGEAIVNEGDPGDSMFLIKSGEVSIQAQHPVKNEQVELARLQGGDFFGEVSLIKNKPRTATVLAESKAEILELKRDDFQKISRKHPEIGKAIENTIEQRVEETIKKMIDTMES
ncbi:MAG: cyclic nucleotide-binding domain-containing protein [bacterium]